MIDVDRIGGVPVIMKSLLDADCCTATASPSPGVPSPRTSRNIAPPDPDGKVLRALSSPIHPPAASRS